MNGWKVTAIFFMFLFALTFGIMIWAYNLAIEDIEKETICMYNTCEDYPYYQYYEWEGVCECYDEDYELTKEIYLE